MNFYKPRAEITSFWVETLKKRNGYWLHDGNPKRPYALLASGKISNFYVNCSAIMQDTRLCMLAAEHLHMLFAAVHPRPDVYCGSAYGAINLAYELARQKEAHAWFTTKSIGKSMLLDRFEFSSEIKAVAVVEDTITKFGTSLLTIAALTSKMREDSYILPCVLCIVNRSGRSEIDGYKIISLVEHTASDWERGANPFTKGGELVNPVKPKQNWDALTRDYS